MTPEQKELIEEKFKGIHILIEANFEVIGLDLDYIKKAIDKNNERVTTLEKSHGHCPVSVELKTKVDKLERFSWKVAGIYIGATTVSGFVFALILKIAT